MISVEVALERILAGLTPMPAETVALPASLGRVLAEPVAARVAHPPLDVSSMDGYAVRAADLDSIPTRLTVIGEAAAGHPFDGSLPPGHAIRIFTGAAVPTGADAVVMQEDTSRDGDIVTIAVQTRPGQYIRPAGQDFSPGQVLLSAGTLMGPRQVALAASMNVPWLRVRRRPRVAILSTGDEIAMPGEPMGPAQLPSSNGLGVAAVATMVGCDTIQLGIAKDTRESLTAMVEAARGCDLLVTSGGASVGDYDLVQDVLTEQGLHLNFWKIALRPGKPLMFGTLKDVPVLGLPGNPVAALVCSYVFLAPMLRTLLGLPTAMALEGALLGGPLPANDARQDYIRATLGHDERGMITATPRGRQDSGMMSGLAAAQAFIVREPFAPESPAGTPVKIHRLNDGF